jgi:hypothetical protein
MSTTEKTTAAEAPKPVRPKRPFFLTLLCLFAIAFFGLISLLILISLLYSGTFRDLINTYIIGEPVTWASVFFILLLLLILYGSSVAGVLLMWRMRRPGYYLFSIPVLAISVFQLLQKEIPVLSTGILIALLVLFGIFIKKMK